MFIKLSANYLKHIATGSKRMPKLYYHPIKVARDFFWLRLKWMHNFAIKHITVRGKCLDFACGSGIFLPTLSTLFQSVVGVDLETTEASRIVANYRLHNVQLVQGDLNHLSLDNNFDAVFAADVLEHFQELALPIKNIKDCLKPKGWLVTSLPTENFITSFTRLLGGYKKPVDHYHTGRVVEETISRNGFIKITTHSILPVYPLYYLSIWQKQD